MKKFTFKKQALILTLVAALGVAVYLNYYFSDRGVAAKQAGTGTSNLGEAVFVKDGDTTSTTKPNAVATGAQVNYFEQARQNREKARDEAVDVIKDIAADIQTDKTAAQKALDQATALTNAVTREAKIEGLIKAKGFTDCVAYIADKNCSVVVKGDSLTQAQTLQITEIVTAQSDIVAQNINIMAVK